MNKREKFIKSASEKHNNKFDYSLVHDFKTQKERVDIICPVHGVFTQRVSDHLYSGGCRKCGNERRIKKRRKSRGKFIQEAKEIHGNRFIYDKVVYVNKDTPVIIICRIHGEFTMTPGNHLTHKKCCNKCSYIRSGRTKIKNILKERFKDLIQPEEYKLIPLDNNNNSFCKVSNEDFETLSRHVWSKGKNGYASNHALGLMHRYLLKPGDNMFVDHINRDTLDNRRSNLRECSVAENSYNSRAQINSSSIYKGVTRRPNDIFISRIKFKDKEIHIGSFKNEIEAAKAYDEKASELFGEFAYLNFPKV